MTTTNDNHNTPTDKIIPALFAAMAKIKKAEIDAVNTLKNSRYPTLGSVFDACREALREQGIFIMQTPFSNFEARTVSVMTKLIHAESGQTLTCGEDLAVYVATFDAQSVGGAVTYLRRYTLAAMLGIVGDPDDDGQQASQRNQQSQNRQQNQQGRNQGNQQKGQQQPRNAQNAPAQGKAEADAGNKQDGSATRKAKPDFNRFWARQRELKVAMDDARAMVDDYNKGQYGEPGTPEADAALIKSLEALAAERRPKAA